MKDFPTKTSFSFITMCIHVHCIQMIKHEVITMTDYHALPEKIEEDNDGNNAYQLQSFIVNDMLIKHR